MERELDLTTASREVLLAIIAKLQQRIETLEGKAPARRPQGNAWPQTQSRPESGPAQGGRGGLGATVSPASA